MNEKILDGLWWGYWQKFSMSALHLNENYLVWRRQWFDALTKAGEIKH